jgi:SAM-dependent methyltransferase
MKQRLVAIARAARLLPALDAVRFLLAKRESAKNNREFLDANPGFSPPPLWWMHDMYRHTCYALYWRTGRETAAALTSKIDKYLEGSAPKVADWGCGLARVIRHLPERYERFGFDYNADAIEWDAQHIDGVRFARNNLSPPLPAEDVSFDALYALSVFTHLSAQAHQDWVKEIYRVLAPGGVFLGAFHMALNPDQLLPEEQAQFDAGELVVRGGVREGSRIFVAYHPEAYIRALLSAGFEILEGPTQFFGQSLCVARKKP